MYTAYRKKMLPSSSLLKCTGLGLLILFALALLSACGGGGGGGEGGSSVNTGTFIDAPVQGLGYLTATQSGTTDNQASFRCEAGEQITFSIGDVVLGTALCKSIITPLDLVPGAADETDPTVTNILRLLQSLDDDCDLDDTIHITPQIASVVSDHPINFNTSVEDFNNGEVADLFNYLNGLGAFTCETPRELRSAEEAREHFRLALEEPEDPEELTAFLSVTPETVIVLEPVTFDASESTGNITEYVWDFGDGQTGSGVETNHAFSATGTYLVTLTVVAENSDEASSSQEIVVNVPPNQPPIASFIATPETGEATLQVFFSAISSSDSDGTIASYSWDFGDGQTSTSPIRTHSYSEADTYLVKLTVTDNEGATAEATTEIVVLETVSDADCSSNPCDDNATCDDSGAEIICSCNSGWTGDGFSCSIADECEGNETLPNGGTACGLNNRGEFGQRCVNGAWQNNPGTCTDPDVCTDGSLTEGSGACGLNGNGTLIQEVCVEGQWTDSGECNDPDVCTNNDTLPNGGAACGLNDRGEFGQRCADGAWQDNPGTCTDPDVCTDGSLTEGSAACGLNGNGTLIQEVCIEGQWTDSDDCNDPDVCTNSDTLPNGGAACGLNNRGEFAQRCVDGAWQDNTDVCSDLDVCIDDSVTDGSTLCGLNDNGTLMQECITGQWTDSDDCDDPDVCINTTTQKGPTPCSGGSYMQLCDNGQWSDTTDCVLDGEDNDGDLVDAEDDPNDADNTVCGDSDSDGCDDCSVAGVFDPDNDGWDENGDGNCELPLDYDCMNGANAATDPYRMLACIQFTYVNQDRDHFAVESGNAAPIEWNEDLWGLAVAHSIDMCEMKLLSHNSSSGQTPFQRAAAAGLSLNAENIASNFNPGAAQYAFMKEPTCVGHRANVLMPLAVEMGIGYYICESWSGYHLVTQDFRAESIDPSAYCQNSANECNVPPNPPSTAICPPWSIAQGHCPAPTQTNIEPEKYGCN